MNWYLITLILGVINSKLVFTSEKGTEEFGSFNGRQLISPPQINQPQLLLVPRLDLQTCKLDLKSLNKVDLLANYSALALIATPPCLDYLEPLQDFTNTLETIVAMGFPPVATVLWCAVVGDRITLGSPDSSIYQKLETFKPDMNINYHIVEDTEFSKIIQSSSGLIKVINEEDPWKEFLIAYTPFGWNAAFKAVKLIIVIVELIMCVFVIARSKGKSHLQISLLIVGILQLGGELVLAWADAPSIVVKLYSTGVLIIASIVNSQLVLSWCNIVCRLRTCVKITPFKRGVVFESIGISLGAIIQFILTFLAYKWIGNNQSWFYGLFMFALVLITCLPVIFLGWFFYHALQFCPVFHATAKLINAQWFTLYIMLNRFSFVITLTSHHLLTLLMLNPSSYLAFNTMNNVAMIVYNGVITLTVFKMQSIHNVKHSWTSEQLGISTLPDGSIVADASNRPESILISNAFEPRTNPFPPIQN